MTYFKLIEITDFRILFGPSFNIQEVDCILVNKCVVYKVKK